MKTERESQRSREQILEESPLLKAFTDPFINNSFDLWNEMLKEILSLKCNEARLVLKMSTIQKDINDLYEGLNLPTVFRPETKEDARNGFLMNFSLLGYEIGDDDDAEMFIEDMVKPLLVMNAVYDIPETRECIRKALRCGVTLRYEVENELPAVFNDAIAKLDLSGL